MSTTPIPHLYRSLLRELRLASHKSRTTRNPTVNTHIRTLIESSSNNLNSLSKILLETRDFLRATRIHAVQPHTRHVARRASGGHCPTSRIECP
nr:hypothetical protein I308_03766 [Cryptococcus tetragattii IND107]